MIAHVSFGALSECYALMYSYGEICVGCNCCGRIDPDTMNACRLAYNRAQLEEQYGRIGNPDFDLPIQQENTKKNIEYYNKRIDELEAIIKKEEQT